MEHKAEEKDLEPVIPVSKVIDLLRGSGLKLSYQQLVDLTKDPSIAPSIKSINKNQLQLNLGDEETSTEPIVPVAEPNQDVEQNPEGQGKEEFNPDDFAMPEGEGNEEPQENSCNEMEPEENGRPQQSVVRQMALRAAKRPD